MNNCFFSNKFDGKKKAIINIDRLRGRPSTFHDTSRFSRRDKSIRLTIYTRHDDFLQSKL